MPDAVTRANVVAGHHEKLDGTGYPFGLQGEQISLEARIVAVVDVFDALLSKRCYKPAFPADEAWAELNRSAGSHLDPELVALFGRQTEAIDATFSAPDAATMRKIAKTCGNPHTTWLFMPVTICP